MKKPNGSKKVFHLTFTELQTDIIAKPVNLKYKLISYSEAGESELAYSCEGLPKQNKYICSLYYSMVKHLGTFMQCIPLYDHIQFQTIILFTQATGPLSQLKE